MPKGWKKKIQEKVECDEYEWNPWKRTDRIIYSVPLCWVYTQRGKTTPPGISRLLPKETKEKCIEVGFGDGEWIISRDIGLFVSSHCDRYSIFSYSHSFNHKLMEKMLQFEITENSEWVFFYKFRKKFCKNWNLFKTKREFSKNRITILSKIQCKLFNNNIQSFTKYK